MNAREVFWLRCSRINRVIFVLYQLAVIAFIQGACAALIFFALVEHNDESVTLFKVLSVAFLIGGLTLIGATTVDARAGFRTRCLVVLCLSLSVSLLVFAVKGAFLAFVSSNINRYGTLVSTPYHWGDLAVYMPAYFIVIFFAAEGRGLWSRSDGMRKKVVKPPTLTDTANELNAPTIAAKLPMKN